ncbi:hypothetical protein [Candidatus Spongiihabitans sp.]|uniref:hypothetical protein n=1 Tax=Candidatus Spongiihabitans sp. TaxID=3101308 RepID=UPI003C6F31AC
MKHFKKIATLVILLMSLLMQTTCSLGERFGSDYGIKTQIEIPHGEQFGNWYGVESIDKMDGTAERVIINTSQIGFKDGKNFSFNLKCVFDYVFFIVGTNNRLVRFRTGKIRVKIDDGEVMVFEQNEVFQDNRFIVISEDKSKKIILLAEKGRNVFIEANIDLDDDFNSIAGVNNVPLDGLNIEKFSLNGFSEALTWCNAF